jgi:hypothetical protein
MQALVEQVLRLVREERGLKPSEAELAKPQGAPA